jgi:mono/diheme cytochrome c family protein
MTRRKAAQTQERLRDCATKGTPMSNKQRSSALIPMTTILCGAAGLASAVLVAAAAVTLSPSQTLATPAYAAETALACGRCHVSAAGGGPNTAFGEAFAANGHKLSSEKK